MTKYTVYSDLHIGHPFEIPLSSEEKTKIDKNIAFLGDNFDIKDTLRKNLEKISLRRKLMKEKVESRGGIFIDGNHELIPLTTGNRFVIRKKILFLHGDEIDWGFDKAVKWRMKKKKGLPVLYWFVLGWWREIFKDDSVRITKKDFERAYSLAKENNCSTIVVGHFHPGKLIDMTYKGVRMVFVPRGRSEIRL